MDQTTAPQTPSPDSKSSSIQNLNTTLIYSLVGVIIALVVGMIVMYVALVPKREQMTNQPISQLKTPTTPTIVATQQAATITTKEEQNPMGQDVALQADTSKQGPWNSDLYIATGADGNTFSNAKVVVERAGVPSLAKDGKGNLYLAFQWFPENNAMAFDKVAIIKSTDGGATWSSPTQIIFKNYPKSYSRPFDPTLVYTKEGKARLYYTVNVSTKNDQQQTPTSYYSALSDDWLNFTFETGQRFAVANTQILDPAAILYNGTYQLTAPKSPNSGAYHATSTDGLTYTTQPDITSKEGYLWTGNLALHPNGLRFYGAAKGGKLFYSESKNTTAWTDPVTININGGDPTVIQVSPNKYILVYVGPPKK